jgi:hypothetical protein
MASSSFVALKFVLKRLVNMTKILRSLAVLLLALSTSAIQAQTDTTLTATPDSAIIAPQLRMPIFTVTAEDLDAELESQDISGLLQSSRDVFTATAGFNFGSARFRIRGYDSDYTNVTINGVVVNDFESGFATWSRWGGLNDITRFMTVRTGVQPSEFNFGGLGGYSNINARATNFNKGTKVSYALANRAYRNRIMITHSTGMLKNGWAFTFSGSRRWAEEGYVEGTFFDAYAYFASAEKKINSKHSIGFVGFGAPIQQGRQGLAIQEAYNLTGSNYYNPFWGYQNGEKRNARISNNHKPMFLATHYFTPNSNTQWTSSIYYSFGRGGITGINWYDAKDPRPDYYRYLPSFFENDPDQFANYTSLWQNNENHRQINWDQLYFANRKNLYTVENANGIEGNNVTGMRSKYIVEELRSDLQLYGFNSVYRKNLSDKAIITAGGSAHMNSTRNYRLMDDLLGGDFWVDVDQFALRDFNDVNLAQNDLDTPNALIKVGDKFGYDYKLNINYYNAFGQYQYTLKNWELYVGADVSHTAFWRESFKKNGRFPESSFGKSETQNFTNYGLKGGATYKITGRHFITANVAHLTKAPTARFAYLSPRTRHEVVPGLTNEKILHGDLNYLIRYPKLKVRATIFYTEINDQLWSRSFYHDELRTFVNYTMTGVDQLHMGTEIGVEANVTQTIAVTAVYGGGQYTYNSRPTAKITRDNADEILASDRTVYLKNYKIGGMPQTAASIGIKYNHPKFWFAGINANYFGHIYLDPNPDRRTVEAMGNYVTDDPQWDQLLDQTRLDDNYTVDLFVGKSWRFKQKYFVNLNLSVNNVLNNQEFAIGGFEQLRYDRTDIDKFPPRLSYLFGRTFFAQISFRI